jgi:hypothetical protein
MTWMTLDQFLKWIEKPKCSHCDKKATWYAGEAEPVYCDDHYPFKLSDETPFSNSASSASDPPRQH